MKTKVKRTNESKAKSRRSFREKDDFFRMPTYEEDDNIFTSLQSQFYGSRDLYIKDRIHACY